MMGFSGLFSESAARRMVAHAKKTKAEIEEARSKADRPCLARNNGQHQWQFKMPELGPRPYKICECGARIDA